MKGILKRLLIVFLVIIGILVYAYQIYLFHLLGIYLGIQTGNDVNVFAVFGIFPLWIFVLHGIHALISWIITGEIYTTKEYKKLYKKIINYKTIKITKKDKAIKQAGNLSIVKKDDTGGLSIL